MTKQQRIDRAWADYSESFRAGVLPQSLSSAVAITICSPGEKIDVQQATELGAMLLLDKPLIVVASPGVTIPSRMRRAADIVIEDWSPENTDAQDRLAAALGQMVDP
jgi:hypothetical protein